MATTLMFVYGTLRPGEYNWKRTSIAKAVSVVAQNVRIPGRMKPVSPHGIYPVVDVLTDTADTIIGDVLEIDTDSQEYADICRMEMGAGYVPVAVSAKVKMHGQAATVALIVWQYTDFDLLDNDLIVGGDWIAWESLLVGRD